MEASKHLPVILLPGVIMPAAIQYRRLLDALGTQGGYLAKDLELYSGERPSPCYNLEQEVEGLGRAANALGWERFHLVGYSGGGAVSLAFAGTYPERVASLALGEPAVIPAKEWVKAEAEFMRRLEQLMSLPPDDQMREFVRLQVKPGVQPPAPPPGDPPDWMAKRPAGLIALSRAFAATPYSLDDLRRFQGPVYMAIGGLSDPIEERKADVVTELYPDVTTEVYEGRHHFDPPQASEPKRLAKALQALWNKN